MRLYTIAEVCRMLSWDSQDSKLYQRVWSACGVGTPDR
jgi:hypothetical protein